MIFWVGFLGCCALLGVNVGLGHWVVALVCLGGMVLTGFFLRQHLRGWS